MDGAGMVEDDATKARSAGAAHVEGLPAGSTPRPHADHAPRLQCNTPRHPLLFIYIQTASTTLYIGQNFDMEHLTKLELASPRLKHQNLLDMIVKP